MFPVEVREAGFTLRELAPSVGASVGSATHSAACFAMIEKMEGRDLPADSIAEEAGITELERRIGTEGVQWDATTPNINTATKQVIRMYRTFRVHLAPILEPVAVERRIKVATRRGNILSGQIDITTAGIRDLKTGTSARANHPQYGGYSMLRRSESGTVAHVKEDFLPRVRLDKEQPAPVEIDYDPDYCERIASNVINDVEEKYTQFVETGDPMVFTANPNSMLCMERFCPAWGTTLCKGWIRR